MIKVRKPLSIKFENDFASVDLIIWRGSKATVANLYSRKRKQGYATDVMLQLIEFADDNQIRLGTNVESYGPGASPERTKMLQTFYKELGFRNTGNNWFVRRPE